MWICIQNIIVDIKILYDVFECDVCDCVTFCIFKFDGLILLTHNPTHEMEQATRLAGRSTSPHLMADDGGPRPISLKIGITPIEEQKQESPETIYFRLCLSSDRKEHFAFQQFLIHRHDYRYRHLGEEVVFCFLFFLFFLPKIAPWVD